MPNPRLTIVYGTRPEAIKMALLARALQQSGRFDVTVVVTGQHRQMLDQVNDLFGVVPDVDLDILTHGQTLTEITTRALVGLGEVLDARRPDAVVVQGDTTTTFCGALAAFYQRIPVVHVEAGLRTDDPYSPFPEEINRRLTSQIAQLHLAPTSRSRQNLLRDGVPADRVVVTGNTVIDALQWSLREHGREVVGDPLLAAVPTDGRRLVVVTTHRRESWGEPMEQIGRAVARIARAEPGVAVVLPIHLNPRVREWVLPHVRGLDNVIVLEPLPYMSFARLTAAAHVVLTDSGGVQEEAPSLGVPVLVMRENTERPEAVDSGTVRLVGTREDVLVDAVLELVRDPAAHRRMASAVNPYGDGQAIPRSVAAIDELFGQGERMRDFEPGTGRPAP